jgi:hypothetical protein
VARILVIGSTGILAPAANALSDAGHDVLGVSRSGGDGARAADARDADALAAALDGESWDEALVYEPAMSDGSLAFVRAATAERCVTVRTTAAADPALGILVVPRDTLQLGWTADEPHRWHTPDEVSEAALEVLADGQARTLGLVRPWSDRP